MERLLRAHDQVCFNVVRLLLSLAIAVEDWRRRVRRRIGRLVGSLRRLRREWLRRHRPSEDVRPGGRAAWNRTKPEMEEQVVRLHVEQPHLGAGQLRCLAFRVLGLSAARETIRRILIRNQGLIAELEEHKRKPPRQITVSRPRALWGADLTLLWILGFFPVWVLGAVDYYGSRLVLLEPLRWPTAAAVTRALERAFAEHGPPARILTDRGSVFRSERFAELLASHGVRHTLTRPCHPWTNGRIERIFRTLKETLRTCFWLLKSRAQIERACADFVNFHNACRPHSSYGGRTPDEVHEGRAAASGWSERVTFFDGRLRWWRFT
jgi:transposase InsO family protein